ncbi:MAG: hypothetical protein U0T32_06915 [Chitinophagales bacterium]
MKKCFQILVAILVLVAFCGGCAREGCTDPTATNYNSKATKNDGSCKYVCNAINSTASGSCGSGYVVVSGGYCCPVSKPYTCASAPTCYKTCEEAQAAGCTTVEKGIYQTSGGGGGAGYICSGGSCSYVSSGASYSSLSSCQSNCNSNGKPDSIYYFTSDGVYLNNTKVSSYLAGPNVTLDQNNNIYDMNTVSVFKNGVAILTPSSADYFISCYYIDGNDIYAGGHELKYVGSGTYYRAVYWKNGVKMPLDYDYWSDDGFIFSISSISKYNGKIYLAGNSRLSNVAYIPSYNMLWENGRYITQTTNYTFYSYQFPITVNGQLVCVSKDNNNYYRLYDTNGSSVSDWYDATTAFSFLNCENNGTSYTVSTRIWNDVGYLKCRTGVYALSLKYLYALSCSYNGTDEYVCLGDRSVSQNNIVYKNGVQINLPAIFSNKNIYKVIAR